MSRNTIDVYTFDQHADQSAFINAKFEGGELLFPPDPLTELAEAIRSAPTVAQSLVSKVLVMQECADDLLQSELKASQECIARELGIAVADRELIALSPTQLARARTHVDQLKKGFLADTGVRAVRTAK